MSTSNKPCIVGLAGTFASGKDSLARYLEEKHHIKHISTSDIVREFAQEWYGSIERPVLYQTANELRVKRGAGVLSEISLERYESYKDQYPGGVCVSGFRAWAEAEVVKKAGGVIIFTDAPVKIRFDRTVKRARDNEKDVTFDEFMARENLENGSVDSQYDISMIKAKADIVIDNDLKLEEFLHHAAHALNLE